MATYFFKFFITCHREVDSRVRTLSGLHAGVLVRQYSNTGYLSSTICQNPEVITQAYNGGLLLSRFRNDANMPDPVREELRQSAKKFGLDFDKMCLSDNSWCPS